MKKQVYADDLAYLQIPAEFAVAITKAVYGTTSHTAPNRGYTLPRPLLAMRFASIPSAHHSPHAHRIVVYTCVFFWYTDPMYHCAASSLQ